jgi:hypothetical protein
MKLNDPEMQARLEGAITERNGNPPEREMPAVDWSKAEFPAMWNHAAKCWVIEPKPYVPPEKPEDPAPTLFERFSYSLFTVTTGVSMPVIEQCCPK